MDKTKIRYWLRGIGEERGLEKHIMTTGTAKVPEVGEVINLNTTFERYPILREYDDILGEENIIKMLRKPEDEVKGDFVVVEVKRWIKIFHGPQQRNSYLDCEGNKTSFWSVGPCEYFNEDFEVFIEPFRHTELTETPIAKLRNQLTPILGAIDMLELITEFPEKEKELIDLFKSSLPTLQVSIEKVRELVKNSKNWK
jgi:hypothetical protein